MSQRARIDSLIRDKWFQFWTPPTLALGLVITVAVWPQSGGWRLEKSLRDRNPAVRAHALRRVTSKVDESILVEALQDENADVRFIAVERLGYRSPEGEKRAKALIPLLKDDHAYVRREAAWSLGYIGPESRTVLLEALGDKDPPVRAGAALALSGLGQKGNWASRQDEAIVTMLRKLLSDEDPEVRTNAEHAIKSLAR